MLAIINKIYGLKRGSSNPEFYLVCCYFFAGLASFLCFEVLRSREKRAVSLSGFFRKKIIFLFLLTGFANFGLNLAILLLASRMDGAIVYPAIRGGGPVAAVLGSRVLFREQIGWKKWMAIFCGLAAILLLTVS